VTVSFAEWVLVALGGSAGAVLRFLVGLGLARIAGAELPWGTLCVNLSGAFVAGLLVGMGDGRGLSANARLVLVTGFLGGFTTFSALGVETIRLAEQQGTLVAGANVAVSIVAGLALATAGLTLGRTL
jgi:CrcB protein